MKVNGLESEYCMSCASVLADVIRNHRRVVVLDGQCIQVYQQSGDAHRLDMLVSPPPPSAHTRFDETQSEEPEEEKKPSHARPQKATAKKSHR